MDDLIAWCIVPFDSRKRTQEERIAMLGGDVTNTGSRAGDEVVQLYVRYPGSRVYRPLKQLRGFQRVALASGETRTVSLRLAAADLAYWDAARHAWTVEPGRVELAVGPSSADADLGLRRTVTVAR
jgi:beta-glucosidase